MQAVRMLIDGCWGMYVPQRFAQNFDLTKWTGLDPADVEIIRQGPDHEYYDDAWSCILDTAEFEHEGHTWTLSQDGDLFALCQALMTNEESLQWFDENAPVPDDATEYCVCGDCLMGLANADYSGMDDKTEAAVNAGLDALCKEFKHVIPDGAELGFSWHRCECCDALAGERYRVLCFHTLGEEVAS